jgi:tripeptide aminopeptidase
MRARACLHATDAITLADMVQVVQIPAPPFGEAARAEWMMARFREVGFTHATLDDEGNVIVRLPAELRAASEPAPMVLISAHLDTVFPAGTELRVRRQDERLLAPGIGDNARGLAALLAIARSLAEAELRLSGDLVFVATVGEEGIGDLRGVKHLFREGSPWREASAFISLDGTGRRRIVNRALASVRLRVTVAGPGGHSWADWGRVNPIDAISLVAAELARSSLPRQPRTSLTLARMGGGTSVNAIPEQAWVELDVRSESPSVLAELEERVRQVVRHATAEINARRRPGTVAASSVLELIGRRPGGETPADSPIVQAASEATLFLGEPPELSMSSTDANVPIALGIPAITLGVGGESGGTHTMEEWYANQGGPEGIERALLTALALVGVPGG